MLLSLAACPRQVPTPETDPAPPPPPVAVVKPVEPTGPGLIVHVEPDDAEVIIDGTSLGIASKLDLQNGLLPLRPGIYQVNLKRAGYVSWRAEVTVNDKPETILVTLKKP
ncbi:MAG: PEGA domain-containing protein [Archangium sp.]|nr:PEGA domain-containing protein [Archangium sp.]